MTFQQAQEAVLSGKADILTSLFYSDKRKERFEFTGTIFDVPASIFIRADRTDIKDLKDLNGKTIAIQKGDYARDFLESQKIRFNILDTKDFAEATDLVIAGKADAVIGDKQVVLYHIYSNKLTNYVKKVGEPLYIGRNCMASNKNNAILIRILNKGVDEARESGILDKLSKKWLGTVYGPGKSILERYLGALSAVVGSILLLSLLVWGWNVRLRTLVRKKTAVILSREGELRKQETKLSSIFRAAPVGIGMLINRVFQETNDMLCQMTGYSREELLGQNALLLYPTQEDYDYVGQEKYRQISAKGTGTVETRWKKKDGTVIEVILSSTPLDPDDLGKGVTFTALDITDRKRAEEVCRKSEEKHRLLFNSAGDAICIHDEQLRMLAVNPLACEQLGYTHAELMSMTVNQVDSPEDASCAPDRIARLMEHGRLSFETMHLHKNGSLIPTEVRARLITWDGQPAIMSICRDITDRKQAESDLQESQERYKYLYGLLRLMCDNVPDMIWAKDLSQRFLFANKAVCEHLLNATDTEEPLGKTDIYFAERERSAHSDQPDWHTFGEICADSDVVVMNSKRAERFDEFGNVKGQFLFLDVYKAPFYDEHGNMIGTVGCGRDLTGEKQSDKERRQAEEALRASQQIIDGIINAIPVRVFWKDKNLIFLGCNKAFARDAGFTDPKDIIGKDDFQMVWRDQAELYRGDDRHVIDSGCSKLFIEEPQETSEGNIITLLTSKIPLYSPKGEISGVLGTYMDITELKQAEEKKRSMEERLQRAEKMESLGLLAGGIAHDLNNVLGILIGYSELLLNKIEESSPVRSYATTIMDASERAAATIQDMLTLARRGVQNRKVVNLNTIILDFLKTPEFEKLSTYHPNLKVKTTMEKEPLYILGSPVQLGKTIMNLVANATEAMPQGGLVTITTSNQYLDRPVQGYDEIREGDYVVLSVSDLGEGIPVNNIKQIFEPFYTKKVMGRSGTGLGLAVVWGTVKDHNGYIDVQSEEGKGSTFTLYFPITREELSAESIPISVSEYIGHGESILVVDDVQGQRDLAAEMLRQLNYIVDVASSGEDAVAYLKDHTVDLLVLDMIMDPGMDGLDTYRKVLEIHPNQKAIIVSGFSETDKVKLAQELGTGAFVKKPYVSEKLGVAIRKELERK